MNVLRNFNEIIYVENTDPFVNYVGGIPTYIRNAAFFMKKKGLKVSFIGSILSVPPKDSVNFFDNIISLSDVKIGHLKFTINMFSRIKKTSIHKKYLIHCQRLMLCLPFIFSLKKYNLICTSHGIERNQIMGRKGKFHGFIYSIVERIVIPRLKLLIVVDPHTENYFKERFPSLKNKIVRIPIGIDNERFYPIKIKEVNNIFSIDISYTHLVFVGRIEYPKNLELLLDAFHIVQKKKSNVKLIIAGEGRDKEAYVEYCRKNNINNVEFIGSVAPSDLVYLLNLCKVLVLSSLSEGSPTVIKEAISCNLQIVSTNVGDVSEVVHNLEGSYIVDFDANNFANAILDSLKTKKVNYQHRVTKYSNEILFDKLYESYTLISTSV